MPKRIHTKGKCALCGAVYAKAGMSKHLAACLQKDAGGTESSAMAGGRTTRCFLLEVQGAHARDYWMHLDVRADATLEELDAFLRREWLECCGHLSAFRIAGRKHTGGSERSTWRDEEDLDVALSKVLKPGMAFGHEYDFGSTTELALQVLSEHDGIVPKREPIRKLVRNDAPAILCSECGELATQLCTECAWDGGVWFCETHAESHECGEEMLMPVVNSPRMGVCGYTG